MQVPINSIVVRERVRKEIGDLSALTRSMEKYGQLSPILLTRKNELIAGYRRLAAARRLGWHSVDAVCVDRESAADRLAMELEENVHRKDFSPAELLDGYSRLERLLKPTLTQRVKGFFGKLFGRWFRRKRKRDDEMPKPGESLESSPDTAASAPLPYATETGSEEDYIV